MAILRTRRALSDWARRHLILALGDSELSLPTPNDLRAPRTQIYPDITIYSKCKVYCASNPNLDSSKHLFGTKASIIYPVQTISSRSLTPSKTHNDGFRALTYLSPNTFKYMREDTLHLKFRDLRIRTHIASRDEFWQGSCVLCNPSYLMLFLLYCIS